MRHALRVESLDFWKQVGLQVRDGPTLGGEGLRQYRDDYIAGMRAYNPVKSRGLSAEGTA